MKARTDAQMLRLIHDNVVMLPICGCWIWDKSCVNGGYGQVGYRGGNAYVHRLTYTLMVGAVPDGLFVLHRCDVPSCCNPHHLFLGRQSANMVDMIMNGRANFGWKPGGKAHNAGKKSNIPPGLHGMAKLTSENVDAIRAACAAGERQSDVGKRFGIHQSHVSRLVRQENWRTQ